MAKKYRVGIIGHTGRGDYGHAVDAAFLKLDNVEVVAVADPHGAGRANAQKRVNATDRDGRCSARDATAIVEMIAAVFESHRLSRPVDLPLKTRVNPLSLLS